MFRFHMIEILFPLLFFRPITMLNALGADECVSSPREIDFKILDYHAKEEHLGYATIHCGYNIIPAEDIKLYTVLGSSNCKFDCVGNIGDRSVDLITMLKVDAKYSVESIILCKGIVKVKKNKEGSNKEFVSLKIPINVAIRAFVCR